MTDRSMAYLVISLIAFWAFALGWLVSEYEHSNKVVSKEYMCWHELAKEGR